MQITDSKCVTLLPKTVSINKLHYFLALSSFCVGLLGCFGWGGYVCLAFSDVSRISSAAVEDIKIYLVRDISIWSYLITNNNGIFC